MSVSKTTEKWNWIWPRGLHWLLTGALAALVAGCGKPAAQRNVTEDQSAAPGAPLTAAADEPFIIDAPGDSPAAPLSEADRAWLDFQKSTQTPDPPERWLTNKPSDEEIETFKHGVATQLVQAADKAKDFYTRYPDHAQTGEAKRQEVGLLNFAVQLGATNVIGRAEKLEVARLKDPKLSEDDRLELRVQQLQRVLVARDEAKPEAALAELERGVRALRKDFPQRQEIWGLMLFAAERWLEINAASNAIAVAEDAAAAEAPDEVRAAARDLVKKAGRLGKPLKLKFTALDGRKVDLSRLQGKVVLVDFWATWCQPCLAELPKVKAAYAKLNAKGFEIVGISFDQDRQALERLVKQEQMGWPQYYESDRDENQFGEQFGISSIPTMWLVDKQGVLRDLNARDGLAEKVEKLLAD